MFDDVMKHKNFQQELDFKETLQARASTKDVTVYSQWFWSLLRGKNCAKVILYVVEII